MATSNLNLGKASGGVLNIQPADGTTTTSIVLPASGTVTTNEYVNSNNLGNGSTTFNGFGGSGFKNYIINGGFDIWQRGTTTVSVQNAANIYHTDRFKTTCGLTTGRLYVSKSSLSYNNDSYSSVKVTSSIATVTSGDADRYFGIGQNIEANSCYNLSGKQITISFLFNTNAPGAFYYSLVCTSGVDSSPRYSLVGAFTAVSGSQKITLNIPQLPNEAIIAGTNSGFNLAIGNVPGSNNASTTTTLSNWLSEGKTYYTNARNWAGTVGNYIEIAQVQLEAGSVATPFEDRPYGLELNLCQRYYKTLSPTVGQSVNATNIQFAINFGEMRVQPSLSLMSGTLTVSDDVSYDKEATPSIAATSFSSNSVRIYLAGWSGLTSPRYHSVSGGLCRIAFSSEL